LNEDATATGGPREDALARALAAAHDALAAKIAEADAKRAAGRISAAARRDQVRAAYLVYERDTGLARVAADTGWEPWAGVGGVLYARRPRSTPPLVVRAPSVAALREAIGAAR
jgi:hypothetical protein